MNDSEVLICSKMGGFVQALQVLLFTFRPVILNVKITQIRDL